MKELSNIELSYSYLKDSKKAISLKQIWEVICKHNNRMTLEDVSSLAELYTDLVLDARFALTKEGKWLLCEMANEKNLKNQNAFIVELEDEATEHENEDDFEGIVSFDREYD